MLPRDARLMTYPVSVTLLCCLGIIPGEWGLGPVWKPAPEVVFRVPHTHPPKPVLVKKEAPRIIAVNQRIARRVNDLRPDVKAKLQRAVGKLPEKVTILVTSAHRTREEQAALRPTFGIKARPGTSTHEDGRAVDVNVLVDGERISPRRQNKVIGKAMASEGFKYLGPADPVHYSIPKEQVAANPVEDPQIEVPTWEEFREIAEHNAMVDDLSKGVMAASEGIDPIP